MAKKLLMVVLLISLIGTLTSCNNNKDPLMKSSKKELVALINNQIDELEGVYTRLDEVEQLLRGIQNEEIPSAAISTMGDGTGRLTFNSYQNKILFPKPFEYPDSSQISNTSSVNITQSLSISPTNNWSLRLNGTTLELEHSSGISGTIKAGSISKMAPRETLQDEVFAPFFINLPPDTVRYSKLFLDDNWWGLQATSKTIIDSEDAYLRCGMIGLGEQSFVYMFVYKGGQDAGKEEVILSLLKTIKLFGQTLRVEQ